MVVGSHISPTSMHCEHARLGALKMFDIRSKIRCIEPCFQINKSPSCGAYTSIMWKKLVKNAQIRTITCSTHYSKGWGVDTKSGLCFGEKYPPA